MIGCVSGALLGNIIPFDTTGVDFVMTALFVVIFLEQWESVGKIAKKAVPKNESTDSAAQNTAKSLALRIKNGIITHIPAVTGLAASLLCLLIFGDEDFLIPSMVLISAVLLAARGRLERGEMHD